MFPVHDSSGYPKPCPTVKTIIEATVSCVLSVGVKKYEALKTNRKLTMWGSMGRERELVLLPQEGTYGMCIKHTIMSKEECLW